MRRMLITLAVIGGFVAAADVAVAQYYGPGYYQPPPNRYYRERYYGDYGGYRPYVSPVDPYGRQYGRRNPNAGCPLGYTVQSGVCKPYRGY